jgi:hypothetical protein
MHMHGWPTDCADEPDDRGAVGEDADDVGAAADLPIGAISGSTQRRSPSPASNFANA